jgi:hypothetical protein
MVRRAMAAIPIRATGVAAVLAGALIFAGHGRELIFGTPHRLVAGPSGRDAMP